MVRGANRATSQRSRERDDPQSAQNVARPGLDRGGFGRAAADGPATWGRGGGGNGGPEDPVGGAAPAHLAGGDRGGRARGHRGGGGVGISGRGNHLPETLQRGGGRGHGERDRA